MLLIIFGSPLVVVAFVASLATGQRWSLFTYLFLYGLYVVVAGLWYLRYFVAPAYRERRAKRSREASRELDL